MKNKRIYLLLISFFIHLSSFAQINDYAYKREIKDVSAMWHKITLPNAIFSKISPNFSDIRIVGINDKKDTLEVPYIFKYNNEQITPEIISFNLINQTQNQGGYYFTFELVKEQMLNQLTLDFENQNFDWRVKLEGSQNQKEWFVIQDDYRILSIKNEATDYTFSTLYFPSVKYRYLRAAIQANVKPILRAAKIIQQKVTSTPYQTYTLKNLNTKNEKSLAQTVIDIDLPAVVPVSYLKIVVKENFDYYRTFNISYLADSTKTPKGWIYNYNHLLDGTLSSLEANEFKFADVLTQKIRIIIANQNNSPLNIEGINAKGSIYELVARFPDMKAKYFLVYGNPAVFQPNYDIANFKEKIPTDLKSLTLANEEVIDKQKIPATEPLFKNQAWLWTIMGIIIVLLGWFSIKMIKNSKQ